MVEACHVTRHVACQLLAPCLRVAVFAYMSLLQLWCVSVRALSQQRTVEAAMCDWRPQCFSQPGSAMDDGRLGWQHCAPFGWGEGHPIMGTCTM